MKIKYKDKDLLDSRSFITFGLGATEVYLKDEEGEVKLVLDFQEKKEEEKEKNKLNSAFEVVSPQEARLTLTNFNHPFGAGFKEPLPLGTFNKRKMYITLHVSPTGAVPDCKLVNLSVYLGEEVHDA